MVHKLHQRNTLNCTTHVSYNSYLIFVNALELFPRLTCEKMATESRRQAEQLIPVSAPSLGIPTLSNPAPELREAPLCSEHMYMQAPHLGMMSPELGTELTERLLKSAAKANATLAPCK